MNEIKIPVSENVSTRPQAPTTTERLMLYDPSLERHNEGKWQWPYIPGAGFSSFNDAGIECETGEFLYSLVRLLKPKRVLETGTHWGIGASYMGLALQDNGPDDSGHDARLDTIEFLPEIWARAKRRIETMGLQDIVKTHLMDAASFNPVEIEQGPIQYGLILLDTEPGTRFAEFLKFYPFLAPGGFVFIHDLHRHMHQIPNEEHGFAWPYGEVPAPMRELVVSGRMRPIHFSTPRGLTGFYKVHPDDYKWENKLP